MIKAKIKSFDDAVQAAIESGKEDDAIILDDKNLSRFDSLFGIDRNWYGWGNIVDVWEEEAEGFGGIKDVYYYDGEFYIPIYCVEYVAED